MDTSTFTSRSSFSKLQTLERIVRLICKQKMAKIPISCPFFKTNLYEYKKAKYKIGDRVLISKYDLPFPNGYKSQFMQESVETVAIAIIKPPIYTIKDDQNNIIGGNIQEKVYRSHRTMESYTLELSSNASSRQYI